MQFSTIIAIIASAAIVSAAPLADGKPSGGEEPSTPSVDTNNGQICEVNQTQACCDTDSTGVLGGLLGGSCALNILGENCGGQSACCQVDGSGSILGGSCQPIISL